MYGQNRGHDYKYVPTILLKGNWLRECGFEQGNRIKVKCEDGRLIIEQDFEYVAQEKQKVNQCISNYGLDKMSKSELRIMEKSLRMIHENDN